MNSTTKSMKHFHSFANSSQIKNFTTVMSSTSITNPAGGAEASSPVPSLSSPRLRTVSPNPLPNEESKVSTSGVVKKTVPTRTVKFPPSVFASMPARKLAEIFEDMKVMFSDFKYFDSLVAEKLQNAIMATAEVGINEKMCTSLYIINQYFQKDIFNTPERKLILSQILIVFKTCYVYMISKLPSSLALRWETDAQLLAAYPEFAVQAEYERSLLLEFRNILRIGLQIIPAPKNKNVLIKVAERLEGADRRYVTGGGQKPAVSRRVAIYLQEGGGETKPSNRGNVNKEKRSLSEVSEDPSDATTTFAAAGTAQKKRKVTITSLKKLKLLRLSSEELKDLSKGPVDSFDDVIDTLEAFTEGPPLYSTTASAAAAATGGQSPSETCAAAHYDTDISPESTIGDRLASADSIFGLSAVIPDSEASDRLVDLMEFGSSRNAHSKLGQSIQFLSSAEHPSELVRTSSDAFSSTVAVKPVSKPKKGSLERSISAGWHLLPGAKTDITDTPFLW